MLKKSVQGLGGANLFSMFVSAEGFKVKIGLLGIPDLLFLLILRLFQRSVLCRAVLAIRLTPKKRPAEILLPKVG